MDRCKIKTPKRLHCALRPLCVIFLHTFAAIAQRYAPLQHNKAASSALDGDDLHFKSGLFMQAASLGAYLQTGIGIVVSIALFLLGYRQTIGARKERTRAANSSLQRALMRRVVLEGYSPSLRDIRRLILGKAREFQVADRDMLTEDEFLNGLFTDIFDSDLIAPEQRSALEARVRSVIEIDDHSHISAGGDDGQRSSVPRSPRIEFALAIATTLLGVVVSLVPQIGRGVALWSQQLLLVGTVAAGSLTAILFIVTVRRTKDASGESIVHPSANAAAKLEMEVARILEVGGVPHTAAIRIDGLEVDFLADFGGEKLPIEVKAWKGPITLNSLSRTLRVVELIRERVGAKEALIVVNEAKNIPQTLRLSGGTRIVSLEEFGAYIRKPRIA